MAEVPNLKYWMQRQNPSGGGAGVKPEPNFWVSGIFFQSQETPIQFSPEGLTAEEAMSLQDEYYAYLSEIKETFVPAPDGARPQYAEEAAYDHVYYGKVYGYGVLLQFLLSRVQDLEYRIIQLEGAPPP